jgi:Tfp pilus assembly protein PilP
MKNKAILIIFILLQGCTLYVNGDLEGLMTTSNSEAERKVLNSKKIVVKKKNWDEQATQENLPLSPSLQY